jgi:hypothetical protein
MRIVCGSCGGESTYPFKCPFSMPTRCPYCREYWWNHGPLPTKNLEHARNLVEAIHYFLDPANAAEIAELKFVIQLELDE